jgi:hypothetical protein
VKSIMPCTSGLCAWETHLNFQMSYDIVSC